MMSYEMMVAQLEALGHDVYFDFDEESREFDVVIQDWEGFDEDWSEVMRDFDDEDAVDAFEEMLEAEALSVEGDFYRYYDFGDFSVCLGFSSFDI